MRKPMRSIAVVLTLPVLKIIKILCKAATHQEFKYRKLQTVIAQIKKYNLRDIQLDIK